MPFANCSFLPTPLPAETHLNIANFQRTRKREIGHLDKHSLPELGVFRKSPRTGAYEAPAPQVRKSLAHSGGEHRRAGHKVESPRRDDTVLKGGCYNAVSMPTVLRSGPYRFYFYSHEPNEPPHVHVDRDDLSAKVWLVPVALAANFGFNSNEIGKLLAIITQHQEELVEKWNEHFET